MYWEKKKDLVDTKKQLKKILELKSEQKFSIRSNSSNSSSSNSNSSN